MVDLHEQGLRESPLQVSCDFIALLHLVLEHSWSKPLPDDWDTKNAECPMLVALLEEQ